MGFLRGFILVLMVALGCATAEAAHAYSGARHPFDDSVKVPSPNGGARITRRTLTVRELAATMNFSVTLKMRNFDELETRIGRGEAVSRDDMEAYYLPAASDYAAIRDWLMNQGFTITQEDLNHTNVFASGTVAQIQNALGPNFVRVATPDGEFTSAMTAPSLPTELSATVLGITGLQPHIRMHHKISSRTTKPQVVPIAGASYLAPSDIAAAYNAPTTLTGMGQTIAIIIDATVANSDLTSFYSTVGSTQVPGNVTTIMVNGGPTSNADADEAALDVEWASGMAPGAKIRLYAISDLSGTSLQAALSMIIADSAANNITVLSMSFDAPENLYSLSSLNGFSQIFAQIAAANITTLCSSGDGGSNPSPSTGAYGSANALTPEYPASDPNIAGIGGTLLTVTNSTSLYVGENVFSTIGSSQNDASGGGVSGNFSRPIWQTDGGFTLTNNTMRCVPDVSIVWGAITSSTPIRNEFALIVSNGQDKAIGGTSLSCQIWAGIVALLNQARANAGMGPIGVLGPAIYPLHGTASFNDVTNGNNGAYNASVGYDLCTGLGSPNITNLANALTGFSTTHSPSSPATTPSGGGGGGGAPSQWFYGALALLVAARQALRRRKADREKVLPS